MTVIGTKGVSEIITVGDSGGSSPASNIVDSVFGRIDDVVAVSGDYNLGQIDNTATYVKTTAAAVALLNTVASGATQASVQSVFGRQGVIVGVSGDYEYTQVSGLTAQLAAKQNAGSNLILAPLMFITNSIVIATVQVSTQEPSVRCRVLYDCSNVASIYGYLGINAGHANARGIWQYSIDGGLTFTTAPGMEVSISAAALGYVTTETTAIPVSAKVTACWWRFVTIGGTGDGTHNATLKNIGLNMETLGTQGLNVVTFNSRTGIVVPVSGDYNLSQIPNGGNYVKITSTEKATYDGFVGGAGVASFEARTGAVISVTGDYSATQVSGLSSYLGSFIPTVVTINTTTQMGRALMNKIIYCNATTKLITSAALWWDPYQGSTIYAMGGPVTIEASAPTTVRTANVDPTSIVMNGAATLMGLPVSGEFLLSGALG